MADSLGHVPAQRDTGPAGRSQVGDAIADAFVVAFGAVVRSMPGGTASSAGGVVSIYSGSGLPPFNLVMARTTAPDDDAFAAALDTMAARGRPWSVFARERHPAALPAMVESRGLVPSGEVPCMLCTDVRRTARFAHVPGLELVERFAGGYEEHVGVLTEAFELPEPEVRRMGQDLFADPRVALAVGSVQGRPVTTAMSFTHGAAIGVFNVGTLAAARGHGYGAAGTAYVTLAGVARGGSWAWLQASPMGMPVYERMGFRTVERWRQWMPPAFVDR